MVGTVTTLIGIASWWVPWDRLPRRTVLWMVPFAFVAVDLGYVYADRDGFNYAVSFVVIFVLVGLTQPRWTSLWLAPLLVAAYLAPFLVTSSSVSSIGLGSALFVIPVCLLLGEAIAWGMSRLAAATEEIAEGEESIRQLFDGAPIGISRLGLDGRLHRGQPVVRRDRGVLARRIWSAWRCGRSPTPTTWPRRRRSSASCCPGSSTASASRSATSMPTATSSGSRSTARSCGTSTEPRCS